MKFANWEAVHLLWVVIGVGWFLVWAARRKEKLKEKFAQKKLLPELTCLVNTRRQRIKDILIVFALGLIVVSFMRPQWGFHWREVKRKGLDILIALDTSKSMLAQDVSPNRLQRAKLAIEDFVTHLEGDRIGLIAFSGEAFLQCPLTVDYNGFLLSLKSIEVGIIPRGGTSLSRAIEEAIRSYKGGVKKYKVLIIISDGEDHEGDPIRAAKLAKKEGIKIFSIGIGTPEGDLIYVIDEKGNKTFLKDAQGNVVKTRLDEVTLQKIALITGGSYVRAGAREFGLNLIYKKKLSKMEKREIKSRMIKQYEERFQIPLLLAFLLLLGELFIPVEITKGNRRII